MTHESPVTDADLDDGELVARCRIGRRDAFETLVRRHSALVGSIAYNISHDLEAARDITQDVFLKVHRRLESLTDPAKLRPWLCGIARTTSVDWLRRERTRPQSLDAMREAGLEVERDERRADETSGAAGEERYEQVLMAIRSLPEIYQEVMLLKHLRSFSYQQIGDFLHLPLATVESRLYRAKLLLKERLTASGRRTSGGEVRHGL